MHLQDFESVPTFVSYFLESDLFCQNNIFPANMTGKAGYIFRGVYGKFQNLPSVFRKYTSLSRFTSQIWGTEPPESQAEEFIIWQAMSEMKAVLNFLEAADRQGIMTPLDYAMYEETIMDLVGRLKCVMDEGSQAASSFYKEMFPPRNLLPAFGLAQHYGVPTRLLDFTESPFVACWFAAGGPNAMEPRDDPSSNDHRIYVYYLKYHGIPNDVTLAKVPRAGNDNLRAQKGLFINFPFSNRFYHDKIKWPALEDYCSNNTRFGAVSLPSSKSNELLRRLWLMDITADTMLPSLNNAAKSFLYRKTIFSGK